MKNFFKELKRALKTAPKQYFLLIFISIVIRALLLVDPIIFGKVIDNVTVSNYNMAIVLLLVLLVIMFIYRLSEGLYIVFYYKLFNKLFSSYSRIALSKTVNNSLFSLSRFSSGEYSNILITDVDVISTFFTTGVIRFIQIVEFLVIYIYFLHLDIVLFVAAVLLSIIMIIVAIRYGDILQKVNEKRKNSLDKMTAGVYGFFNNIKEIKSYHLFGKVLDNGEEEINQYLKNSAGYSIHYNVSNQLFLYAFELFRLLSVLYGFFLIQRGDVAVGTLLIIYNYYQKIIDNFTSVLTTNVDYRNLVVSLNRFNKIIEYSRKDDGKITLKESDIVGTITFENILYGFKDNPTLNNANMFIKENSITVLKGRDEAAQNGIFDLLLKLNRQHEGRVLIDQYSISDICDDSYYDIISCARRESNLFNASIKENLLTINDEFDEVLKVSKMIGLDEKIMKLNDGYDTVLSESTPISLNTRMLLIIARCLLKKSKIILMDDIVDSLDIEHEKLLLKVLCDLKKNHTIIIIGNSEEVLSIADCVYEINNKKAKSIK